MKTTGGKTRNMGTIQKWGQKQYLHITEGHNVRISAQSVRDDTLVAFLRGSQLGLVFPVQSRAEVRL